MYVTSVEQSYSFLVIPLNLLQHKLQNVHPECRFLIVTVIADLKVTYILCYFHCMVCQY